MPETTNDASTAAALQLPAGEVHSWSFRLDGLAADERDALAASLDDAERMRASRFVFAVDRERFIVGRGRVRQLLGRYVGADPPALVFTVGSEGKPSLERPGRPPLQFNFSNSHDRALLAVGRGAIVGADIEMHRPLPDLEAVARRHFAPVELAKLLALEPAQREAAFYACWTRKEALVKALGGGLTIPLAGFEVEFLPSAPAALLSLRSSTDEAKRWTLWNVDLGAGVSAAIVVRAGGVELRSFTLA